MFWDRYKMKLETNNRKISGKIHQIIEKLCEVHILPKNYSNQIYNAENSLNKILFNWYILIQQNKQYFQFYHSIIASHP